MDEPAGLAAIASPIDLLLDETEAREVLVLSYTVNLDFWERFALSLARGLGAAVTVVGDAAMVAGDPAHVRYAGATYLDGRAACRGGGAFHPKLLVIAGETYATVAIGSGNLTVPGWHDNAELWTVLRGDSDGAPTTFGDLATWLRGLRHEVIFSDGVVDTLERVATRLAALPLTDPGPQLVSSLSQPILDQLPNAPVSELTLVAPFHDRRNAAIDSFVRRFRPGRTHVLLQPRDVVANGAGLVVFLAAHNGEALEIAGDRYHHGKLYEWQIGDLRYALTGSPNLSTVALTRSMAEGANCELGVVTELVASIIPAVGESAGAVLASIAFEPREPEAPTIVLLGGAKNAAGDGIIVHLRAPLDEEGILEALGADVWETVAPVPPGEDRVAILGTLPTARAVRVRVGDLVSNVCFITDLSRVRRVRVEHQGRVRTDEVDVFVDPRIAEGFALDLAELRGALQAGRSAGGGGRVAVGGAPGQSTFESWETYLDRCSGILGERLLAYGLALPALEYGETGGAEIGDEDDLDAVLDGGDAEPEEMKEPALPLFDDRSQRERARYRRWCERLARLASDLPVPGKLVALRLLLRAVAGNLFEKPDEWIPLVAQATTAVAAVPSDAFAEEFAAAATLGATALSIMRGHIEGFTQWGPLRGPYERAAASLNPLLKEVDPDRLDRLAVEFATAFPAFASAGAVRRLVDSQLSPDPLEEVIEAARGEYDIELERDGSTLRSNARVGGDPRRVLLRLVALAERCEAAVAIPADHGEALAAWIAPNLVVIRPMVSGISGSWYILRGFGPSAYHDIGELPRPKATWTSDASAPDEVRAMLELLLGQSAEDL